MLFSGKPKQEGVIDFSAELSDLVMRAKLARISPYSMCNAMRGQIENLRMMVATSSPDKILP
jgi:hypothetical protein